MFIWQQMSVTLKSPSSQGKLNHTKRTTNLRGLQSNVNLLYTQHFTLYYNLTPTERRLQVSPFLIPFPSLYNFLPHTKNTTYLAQLKVRKQTGSKVKSKISHSCPLLYTKLINYYRKDTNYKVDKLSWNDGTDRSILVDCFLPLWILNFYQWCFQDSQCFALLKSEILNKKHKKTEFTTRLLMSFKTKKKNAESKYYPDIFNYTNI